MNKESFIKHRVGNYLVTGNDNDWRVMEQFGNYRMLKKVFKTADKAIARATELDGRKA